MRRSSTTVWSNTTKHFFPAALFLLLWISSPLSAQPICFNEFCVEVDPTNPQKCRLVFTFETGFLHEIECGRPGSPAAGSDASFYAAITHFEVSDGIPGSTQRVVAYNKPNLDCTGAITKLQYHPSIPNAVMTAYAPQFCRLGYEPVLEVTLTNDLGETVVCEPNNKNPLPVEWVSVGGKLLSDKGILIDWKVASQINNSHFEVQHSSDGINYRTLHLVKGDGNFSSLRAFSYAHRSPKYGPNYYRIRQVDFDGRTDFSEVVVVNLNHKRIANIFPSIFVTNELGIELETKKDAAKLLLTVADLHGNVVHTETASITEGVTLHRVSLPHLSTGIYILYVKTESGQIEAHKFIRAEE